VVTEALYRRDGAPPPALLGRPSCLPISGHNAAALRSQGAAPIFAEKEEFSTMHSIAGFHSFCCLYRFGAHPELLPGRTS